MRARALLPGLSAAGALGLSAAVLVAGTGAPAPALGVPAADAGVRVPAASVSLVCPGPPAAVTASTAAPSRAAVVLQLLDRAGAPLDGAAPTATALAVRPDPAAGPAGADRGAAGPAPSRTPATAVGAPLGRLLRVTVPGDGGGAVTAGPVQGRAPVVAGTTTALAASGDLRGLSAPACQAPGESPWLVGGTTGVGRSVRLVVANPGPGATTVDTTVLTAAGPQRPPALQGLSLAAGERRSVLLEGAVDGTGPLAVQVRPAAGRVAAWLTEQVLRGLVPGGGDVVVAGAGPARHVLVPGVVVPDGGAAPVLRLAAPGARPVVARYALLGPDGALVPAGTSPAVVVPAGSVVDVPLPGLRPGELTAVVDGDGPLVAGALTDTAPSVAVPGDTAWTSAASPLGGPVLLALPPAVPGTASTPVRSRLVLTAPGAGSGGGGDGAGVAVDVRVLDATGSASAPQRVRIPPGTTRGVDVAALAASAAGGARTGSPVGLVLTPVAGATVAAALRADAPAPEGTASGAGPLLSVHPVAPLPGTPGRVRVHLAPGA